MRRWLTAFLAPCIVAAVAAEPAAAQGCSAPERPAWHSCLHALYEAPGDGTVLLTHATPTLVQRFSACPARTIRRTVRLRTDGGRRLGERRVRARCRRGVARWRVTLRPDVELPAGTVVRSYWSGIGGDNQGGPGARLEG